MPLYVLSEDAVAASLTRALAFSAVRDAFIASANGDGEVFPVAQGNGNPGGSSFSLKSARVASRDAVGFKFGSYWPSNRALGIPSHASLTVLIDGATGLPRAIINASRLNGFRTAAANAVATDALARQDSETLGVIGAGHQAEFEIRAILDIRPVKRVLIWNRTFENALRLREALRDLPAAVTVARSIGEAIASDIVITVTAAREILVPSIGPGTHLSAMGSDQPGKQEIAVEAVAKARLFADQPEQSVRIGEFQHVHRLNLVAPDAITPIGAVLSGSAAGRQSQEDITIFDSSGIAMQDILVGEAVLQAALAAGTATLIPF